MGDAFKPIQRIYTIRDTNAKTKNNDVMPFMASQNGRGGSQPLQSNGRRMLQDISPNPRARRFALNFNQVAQKFNAPIGKAAKDFQLSTSTLKLRCRELGFKKWPYPKLKSLSNLVNDLTKYRVRDFQNIVEEILEEIESIKENPSLDIKSETKILRQQMYELKKKKKRRMIDFDGPGEN
ncbi:hypothetical protein LUZ63_009138 [Rhynchospora breviuscula]|uniref:RWP-RK domain-containing protein n=1 Tax=Rhynchospora breviuscula TaxID=2022672 RepID=A0A9Q0CEL2_9POAL|nr:hypothetical protein LUZ63_009138 [Rhynchospora breviuscula]